MDGWYEISCYGTSGGSDSYIGGKGGFSKGTFKITTNTQLKVYVGDAGGNFGSNQHSTGGGWNGGGDNGHACVRGGGASGGGGGGTDVRFTDSLYDRIIVAGAGGGGCALCEGSNGGGLTGQISKRGGSSGGTQTYAGRSGGFGYGGGARHRNGDGGGGGAGWYGGGSGTTKNCINDNGTEDGGSGGSSYISGHSGCAVNSRYVAINTYMDNGTRSGNGFIRILLMARD